MVEAHVGDVGIAEVVMRDASGEETDTYDEMSGIQYASSNEALVSVVNDDAEPRDAKLQFHTVSDEDVFITCVFDGDPGDGTRQITLQSEAIRVVPGEATGGEVRIRFEPVSPSP